MLFKYVVQLTLHCTLSCVGKYIMSSGYVVAIALHGCVITKPALTFSSIKSSE